MCRWSDWRYDNGQTDTGIDVAHRVADDSWVAIQVKFYKPTTSIQKGRQHSKRPHRLLL
ncbi:restriction endonuclease [Corynebacterium pseudodiphtheriticum]|uniref:restriction endonuclease n=1 Tax=Corynebacterium pseudodiphtheriticum TaxID=37637 RepID=UPI00345E1754